MIVKASLPAELEKAKFSLYYSTWSGTVALKQGQGFLGDKPGLCRLQREAEAGDVRQNGVAVSGRSGIHKQNSASLKIKKLFRVKFKAKNLKVRNSENVDHPTKAPRQTSTLGAPAA